MFDDEGNIKLDDEAVEFWFNYCSRLLGGRSIGDAHTAPESSCQGDDCLDLSDRLSSPISAEEICRALEKVMKYAAPCRSR